MAKLNKEFIINNLGWTLQKPARSTQMVFEKRIKGDIYVADFEISSRVEDIKCKTWQLIIYLNGKVYYKDTIHDNQEFSIINYLIIKNV